MRFISWHHFAGINLYRRSTICFERDFLSSRTETDGQRKPQQSECMREFTSDIKKIEVEYICANVTSKYNI